MRFGGKSVAKRTRDSGIACDPICHPKIKTLSDKYCDTWRSTRLLISGAVIIVCLVIAIEHCRGFDFDLNKLPEEQNDLNQGSKAAAEGQENSELNQSESERDDDEDFSLPKSGRQPKDGDKKSRLWDKVRSLPRYFDYNLFKHKFGRYYKRNEDNARQSVFIQRCVAIFKSRVAYRAGLSKHLETINKFADRTDDEIEVLFMAAPPEEFLTDGPRSREFQALIRRRERLLRRVNRKSYMPELPSQSALDHNGDQGGLIMNALDAKRALSDYYSTGNELENVSLSVLESALKDELGDTDIELESQGAPEENSRRRLPVPGIRKSSEDAHDFESGEINLVPYGTSYKAPELKDDDWLDWSVHECFHTVYNQTEKCGKCYAVASTSVAEFYTCTEQVPFQKRKFSQNYVIDCAQKYTPHVMGCHGGSSLHTLSFIAEAGIMNITDWREQKRAKKREAREQRLLMDTMDLRCPLWPNFTVPDHPAPYSEWGNVKITMNPKPVVPNKWIEALQDGPLVVSVQVPENFVSYKTGVNSGSGCENSNFWHVMVLVGYGKDQGESYWRFRNSFGPDWGDRGHFNLAMSVSGNCLRGAVRVYREPFGT